MNCCLKVLAAYILVMGLATPVSGEDAEAVLARAFAERMKTKSVECIFTTNTESGSATRTQLIVDGRKVFLNRSIIEKGALPDGQALNQELHAFDGTTLLKSTNNTIRQHETTAPRRYPCPTQVAFQWLASGMMIGRDIERLSEWELWGDFGSRVTEVLEVEDNIIRLRAENLPAPIDYLDVYFDSSKNYYPVRYESYRDGTCIVRGQCNAEIFKDSNDVETAYPVFAEYRTFAGPNSFSSWTSHDVDRKSVAINPIVDNSQFTRAALPQNEVVDVDSMNARLGRVDPQPANRLAIIVYTLGALLCLLVGMRVAKRV